MPFLLTISEVARRLRVHPITVRRWLTQGALEGVLLPHTGSRRIYRVSQNVFQQLLQEPLPS